MFFKKKKEEPWDVPKTVYAEGERPTSVATERLKVSEFRPTDLDDDEEVYWAEMTKKRLANEKAVRANIIWCIIVFVIMCIGVVVGLIWYAHTGGGVHPWR